MNSVLNERNSLKFRNESANGTPPPKLTSSERDDAETLNVKLLQHEHSQWRHIDLDAVRSAMLSFVRHGDVAEVSDVAAAVDFGVAVQQFDKLASVGHAHAIVILRFRSEVQDDDNRLTIPGESTERVDTVVGVVRVDL